MPELRGRDAAPDRAKLYYAGRFAPHARNADGLRDLLEDYFEVPVELREFEGSWIEIPEPERLRLGESPLTGALGVSTIVGSRVWDRQLKFRLICGPMGLADYERLLPDRESLARMEALVRQYITDEFAWDLQLVLKREEVPRIELGRSGRLGWTTWLLSGEAEDDSDDLVLDPVTSLRTRKAPVREAA
jgi:type VI secretion system protein ImpH